MALDAVQLKTLAIELSAIIPPPPVDDIRDELSYALPIVAQSPRARAIRRIADIVQSRQWFSEIVRTLDRHQVNYIDDLPDEAVFTLLDRMEYYEDCVQFVCDPDDAPPAR